MLLGSISLDENLPADSIVTTIGALDPDNDVGDTHTFSLIEGKGGDDNTSFSIEGNELKATTPFDYETEVGVQIRLRATDAAGLHVDMEATISILDVNDAPVGITLDNSIFPENQKKGYTVGNLSAVDADAGEKHTFKLVEGEVDNDLFTLSGNRLRTGQAFDYEAGRFYSVKVEVTDVGGATFQQELPISITDLNETPLSISLSHTFARENSSKDTVVGTFATVDPDRHVTRRDDLVLWFSFDEVNGATPKDHSANDFQATLVGQGTRQDGQFGNALYFNGGGDRLNVSHDPKLDLLEYSVSVWLKPVRSDENAAGVFGRKGRHYTFFQTSANHANGWVIHHRYSDENSWNSGASNSSLIPHDQWVHVLLTNDGTISRSYANGIQVGSGTVEELNYTNSPIWIGTHLDHGDRGWYEGLLDDVRLYGVALTPNEVATAYNNGLGDFGEHKESFTYKLASGGKHNGDFVIRGNELQTKSNLDFEDEPIRDIRVEVTDAGGNKFIEDFEITILPANDGPTALDLDNTEISEKHSIGQVIGNFSTSDPDASNAVKLDWFQSMGGTAADQLRAIHTLPNGNLLLAGHMDSGVGFFGGVRLARGNDDDSFIAEINEHGEILWAKTLGISGYDSARSVTTDIDGNIYVAGITNSSISYSGGTAEKVGSYDPFIVKLDATR